MRTKAPTPPAPSPIPKIDDPRVRAIVAEFNARPMRRETDIRIQGWSVIQLTNRKEIK